MKTSWSWSGEKLEKPNPSWVFLALGFVFAAETFLDFAEVYPLYMVILALGAGAFGAYLGIKKKAILGLVLIPVSALWLNPLFGGDWFDELNTFSFLAHGALALLFGLAGYTFAAWERT